MPDDVVQSNVDISKLVGKKALIVEDDAFLGRVLLKYMAKAQMKADLLSTGEGAVEAIKKNIPDVLVLDLLLPGMGGLDILQALRNDPATETLPVLVVSNSDQNEDRERAKSLRARFLTKAFVTPANIIEGVVQVLSGKYN